MAGLSFRTSEESLRNAFQSFGQLIEGIKWCRLYFTFTNPFYLVLYHLIIRRENFACIADIISDEFAVNLVMDKIANRPRGFAFLRYATKEESEKAIEGMHGKVSFLLYIYVSKHTYSKTSPL